MRFHNLILFVFLFAFFTTFINFSSAAENLQFKNLVEETSKVYPVSLDINSGSLSTRIVFGYPYSTIA